MVAQGAQRESIPRASLRWAFLKPPAGSGSLSRGWFAKVLLHGGERVVGTLRAVRADSIELFSGVLGRLNVERAKIRSISFSPSQRTALGSFLVCGQRGVWEVDWARRELWRYTKSVNFCWAARRTGHGTAIGGADQIPSHDPRS